MKAVAEIKLQTTQKALVNTPAYVRQPVEQAYKYVEATIQVNASIGFEYRVMDLVHRKPWLTDRIERKDSRIEHDISGAHPQDTRGIRNRQYSRDETTALMDRLKERAIGDISKALAAALERMYLYRGQDLMGLGAAEDGREAILAYTHLFGEKYGMTGGAVEKLLAQETGASSRSSVKVAFAERSFPKESLVYQGFSKPRLTAMTPQPHGSKEFSTEEIARVIGPAVVSVQTFLASGSGVIIRSNGTILTNAHIVEGTRDVAVYLQDGRRLLATVLKIDPNKDLALLKVEATNLPFARMGDFKHIHVGEDVVAIGAPFGLSQTVTKGIVSALHEGPVRLVQTDAALNPGSSGGPLINRYGSLLGITTFKFRRSEGIGFAVAVDEGRALLGVSDR